MQLPSEVPLADSRLVIAREFRMWRYSLTCTQHQDVAGCRSAQRIWQPLPSGSICHQTPAQKMKLSAVWELQFLVSSIHIGINDSCRPRAADLQQRGPAEDGEGGLVRQEALVDLGGAAQQEAVDAPLHLPAFGGTNVDT